MIKITNKRSGKKIAIDFLLKVPIGKKSNFEPLMVSKILTNILRRKYHSSASLCVRGLVNGRWALYS